MKNALANSTYKDCVYIICKNPNTNTVEFVIVDINSLPTLSKKKWFISDAGYAISGDKTTMHEAVWGDRITAIDHINRCRTDNRINNLRKCTPTENSRNRAGLMGKTSPYKGVSWCKCSEKWVVRIGIGGKYINGGRFKSEIGAALRYNELAKKYHKEFAYSNKIS
jgi:hypothetical protein